MHEGLWEQLENLRPEVTARRAKCRYLGEEACYGLRLLDKEYVIDVTRRRIFSVDSGQEEKASFLEQFCLLAYLINAQDLPLANQLVSAEKLPSGQFFFRGLHSLPTGKLIKVFGSYPMDLYKGGERLGAKRCEFGDASIELYVLPRIPLTMVVWGECREFDARASILFDQTAAEHMPLDALLTAVNIAVNAVVKGV